MINRSKYIKLVVLITLISSFTSCLKKDDIPDLTKVEPVIEFPLGGPGLVRNTLSAFSTDVVDTVIALNIASPDPLGKDIKVTVAKDDASIAKYNADHGTTYVPLAANMFEIVNPEVTIRAGYRIGKVNVKIKFNQFAPNTSYMLALGITNAPGMTISGNFGKFLWAFVVKNPLEGDYTSKGVIDLYNGPDIPSGIQTSRPFDKTITTATVDATTILAQIADLANVMNVSVNSVTNEVTVSPAATNSFTVVANNGPCTYNPTTKTLNLRIKYINPSGNLREVTQTMVKK